VPDTWLDNLGNDPVEVDLPLGVLRYVLHFDGEPEVSGNLSIPSPEMDRVLAGEALARPMVAYLLSERRLRDLLLLAAAGNDIGDLVVSVEALTLEAHRCARCGKPYPECQGEG
jgi:hypothetical protein